MADSGDYGFLNFGARPRRIKGRGFYLPLSERLRAARKIPQAVVKVASFSHGTKQVGDTLRYITRQGKLVLEKDTGEILSGEETPNELANAWAVDFSTRKRSRDAAHIVFSMPWGSDVNALKAAVRLTAARIFEQHEWVFTIHEDKKHPHAHMVVKMRSRDAEKTLRFRKADLHHLREQFAQAAREQGVQLAASPRAARGVGRKPERLPLVHMRMRGKTPKTTTKAIGDFTAELKAAQTTARPWETKIRKRFEEEKAQYESNAASLREAAHNASQSERAKLLQAANALYEYGRKLPEPKTRFQSWLDRIRTKRSLEKIAGHDPTIQDPKQ